MRIVFDVSPLSHERTGVNNYIRGSLAGLAAAAQREGHEVVAFAPTSPEGKRVIPEALDGHPGRAAPRHAARRARLAHRVVAARLAARRALARARSTCSTSPTGCIRRSAPACARPRSTTSCRCTSREWVTGRTRSMHGRKYANAARTCDVMFANSAFTADDTAATLGFPRERIVVAHPGIGAEYSADGEAADLGAPYLLTVATLEPRKNLGTLVDAFALLADDELSLAVVGGAGWGPQPRARPAGRRPARARVATTSSRGSTAARPRSSTRRGSRGSACRSPRRWPPARRSSPRRTRRMDEACGDAAVRADPESPEAIAAAIRDALGRRDELRAKGLEHAAQLLVGADRRALPRGIPPILVGSTRRRSARPAPARRATCGGCSTTSTCALRRAVVSGHVAAAHGRRRRALVPAPRVDGVDVLHCPTFRGPFSSKTPLVVTVHDLAVLRRPEWFNRWTRTYSRFAVPRVVRAASRVIAVSEFTKRELVELLARARRRRSASCRTRSRTSSRPTGPRAEGDYVLAVGTLEPRKNLAAHRGRGRRRAARRRRARLGQRRAAGERRRGSARSATRSSRALYRGARCLVYASLYEGFGIPVAEALACGCPVVTSAGSAMAEFAGDDATYVDPTDVDSIREGIARAFRPEPRRVASWTDVAARDRATSTRRSRDPASTPTCSAARAPATRRTCRTCCASCRRRRPTCASPR